MNLSLNFVDSVFELHIKYNVVLILLGTIGTLLMIREGEIINAVYHL